ncbi:MAG: hypothetical protein LCH52_01395 [Bacteroidetes bacterium]|nr:hypothetical protein [Bacteroidota bacterium]
MLVEKRSANSPNSPSGDIWAGDADTRGMDGFSQMRYYDFGKGATIVSIVLPTNL